MDSHWGLCWFYQHDLGCLIGLTHGVAMLSNEFIPVMTQGPIGKRLSRWLSEREGSASLSRGGNQIWMLKPQVNFNVIPIYKNREKRIFEFGDRLNPPHWPPIFEKSLYKGQKSKLSQTYGVTYQNVCEKGTKPTKKDSVQSGLPVKRKIQKTTRKYHFPRKWYFQVVFWIFSNWAKTFPIGLVPFSHKFW